MRRICILAIGLLVGCLTPLFSANGQFFAVAAALQSGGTNGLREAGQISSFIFNPPAAGSSNSLGTIVWTGSGSSHGIVLLSPTLRSRAGNLICESASRTTSGNSITMVYAAENRTQVRITASLAVTANTLGITLDADQPVIVSADMGAWPPALASKKIAVPYYTGNVWYASALNAFVNAWWDFHETHGAQFNGTSVQYQARTDGTLVRMHEKLVVAISPNVDDVLPSTGNPVSSYLSAVAGRMVEDIWTPGFATIKQGFEQLGDYGITNCIGIIHDWQHAGYDNGLPQHYPANEKLGGDAGLKAAISAGKADGCLMALHENYIDYYPNYPDFNPAAVAMKGDSQRATAWRNGSGIQSFQAKSSWMVKNAATQSPEIHQRYGTTSSFLDVNSAVAPYFKRDMDPAEAYGGTMQSWMKGATDLWSYERKTEGGPVFGEGLDHWYYSGLLDGVEAQMGAGSVPQHAGGNIPLFVDFDLLRIHPLQVNHGMGYYGRWTSDGAQSMTTLQLDAYRMQEVAFGHAPFLGTPYWNDVPHALVESNLVSPAAKSYGTAHVNAIHYQVNGAWTTPSAAAEAGVFDRVEVQYDNGLEVVANASASPLLWNGLTLPQYGWVAKGRDQISYTALCGKLLCDYAQTPNSLFANARNQADLIVPEGFAKPSVVSVKEGQGRTFAITYNWAVYQTPAASYKSFVHFVNDKNLTTNAGIVFQGDHAPPLPTSQWVSGKTMTDGPYEIAIPSSLPDGTYSIRIGLIDPATGARVQLVGDNDGTGRYILGHLAIGSQGTNVSFVPLPQPPPRQNDPRLNAEGAVLNFGPVQTDGMISIHLENGRWVLRPFPRTRNFTVLLRSDVFSIPSALESAGGSTPSVIPPREAGGWWKLSLNGAKAYSWAAPGASLSSGIK